MSRYRGVMSIIIVTIFVILVAGCTPSRAQLSATKITTPTRVYTVTHSAVNTTSPTETHPPATTEPITLPSTATSTWTPRPTLPHKEALAMVQELLQTNGGCRFPCWWGITPGATPWNEAKADLQVFGWKIAKERKPSVPGKKIIYIANFAFDDPPIPFHGMMVTFLVNKENGVIERITTSQNYPLKPFLETFGAPDEIWLIAAALPVSGPGAYHINLFYPDFGIMAGISGKPQIIHQELSDIARICREILIEDAVGLDLWSPKERLGFKELSNYYRDQPYVQMEETTNIDIDEFYELILEDNSTTCLEIPMSIWYEP